MTQSTPRQTPAQDTGSKPPRLAFVFILITLAIDAMGIGLILPVLPDLISELNGGTLGQAAIWGGVLSTSYAIMQFLCGPTIGSLSDRFGRRPVLLISLTVMALDYVVMALAGSIWLLLAGRIVGGVAAATQATATAFIADISKPEEKSKNFGLVGAAFGIGFVVGPLIGGVLGELGLRAPFYAAAALATFNLILGYYVLPETVTDRIRRPFSWRRANPLGAFRHISALPGVRRYLTLFFLYEFAFFVYPAIWAYFTRAQFGWEPGMVGLSLGLFGVAIAVVQGGLIRWILPTFGEARTIVYGFAFNFCAFLALATVTSGGMALILTPLTALGAVVTPALQGLMSRAAGEDQQGELQGLVSSIRAVSAILSPLVMTQIFFLSTDPAYGLNAPGAPFFLSMGLMALCLAIYLPARRPRVLA
ncbi:TCR/Tet family MFS transporter [Tropicimonas sp. S265A]|uniref:TCR/Tet family MFS transporter n=1 Tax=Tropicimonas sp. S265A TaxID=3415134 RepID=UPI003C7B15EB